MQKIFLDLHWILKRAEVFLNLFSRSIFNYLSNGAPYVKIGRDVTKLRFLEVFFCIFQIIIIKHLNKIVLLA